MIESEILFEKEKTCCFTGHRVLKNNFNEEKLKKIIETAIEKGYKTFLTGMAIGFDLKACETLLNYKEKGIEIVACIPCKGQEALFNKKQKQQYNNCLKNVDKKIYLNESYFEGCMQQRNRFMVDNSSLVIAYYYSAQGGTYHTVNYAERKKREIIFIE